MIHEKTRHFSAEVTPRAVARPQQEAEALAARRHVEVVAAQFALEHRDRRAWIAVPALADRDGGFEALRREAALDTAVRELVDEHPAVRCVVRRGLGVAARGDAQAGNQRHDRAREQYGCLFHLRFLSLPT